MTPVFRLRLDHVGWLAVPALGYLTIFYLFPLAWLLAHSVVGRAGFTLDAYTRFFADPFNWRVILNTLRIAGLVTLLCLVIGYPVAFALARARGLAQVVLLTAIILPLSIGVVVKAFAWQIVLRRDGAVSQALMALGVWDEPQRLLFTETGLVLGAANVFLPFMILPVYSVVKLIDPRLSESAATLGATPLYRFWRIILPLSLPGIVTGVAFVFSLGVSMFVIPSSDRRSLPDARDLDRARLPDDARRAARIDHRGGAAGAGGGDRGRQHLAGEALRRHHMTATERAASIAVWTTAAVAIVFLLTPLVITVIVSFGSSSVFTLPPPGWSTRWYERLPATQGLLSAVLASVEIAALSTWSRSSSARSAPSRWCAARFADATRSRPCWSRR